MAQKLTTEEFIQKAKAVHGDKYDYSETIYNGSNNKVIIICPDHGKFEQLGMAHLKGQNCRKCVNKNRTHSSRKLTTEKFITKAKEIHGDKYDYSKVVYVKSSVKVIIICPIHGKFEQTPASHLSGSNCPKCIYNAGENFIQKANYAHNNKFDYSKTVYINNSTKVIVIDENGFEHLVVPYVHLSGADLTLRSVVNKKEWFIHNAKITHGDRYDYSKVVYVNTFTKVIIICSEHGEFEQTPIGHLSGRGCVKCGNELRGQRSSSNIEKFTQKAKIIHGDKYDYSKTIYEKANKKVIIICPTHGEFEQTPNSHLSGSNCPKCVGVYRQTTEEFVHKAKEVHGDKYNYSKSVYTGTDNKVIIICPKHGEFEQTSYNHLKGSGCAACNSGWTRNALLAYLTQMKSYLYVCSIPQLMTIIEANGLYKYLTKEKIKKIQDTPPDSKERVETTDEIIKDITEIEDEELVEVDDTNTELTEDETGEFINDVPDEEETDEGDKTELIEKQLKALDNNAITASLDDERVQFIVRDMINSMWYDVLNNRLDISKIESLEFNTEVPERIKSDFINEYNEVMNLHMPQGWTYEYEPLLMQKLISYRLSQHKRYGNWSGVGAGKTIGGILAGRYVGAKNTLIITFNSTIGKEDERGWTKEIRDSFKDSRIYTKINRDIKFDNKYHNYLVLNYETFQQKGSANYVIDLLEKNKFDYIILDEVQSVKQRNKNDESKRREVVFGLVGKVRELNPDYYLLAMSATPVINNLVEAKSLVELIDFTTLDDVNTKPSISNCIELFRRLTNCGIRHKNIEDNILKNNKYTLIQVDTPECYEEACELSYDDVLAKERLMLEPKLNAVLPYINTSKGKTVIYTHYVGGIEDAIYEYLTNLGYKVGMYTGSSSKYNRDSTLTEFINGEYDILLGSRPVGTGVNGLQFVSDRLIILSLPWTNAELEQLVGRVNRKRSNFTDTGVDVIIPLVRMDGDKKTIRWDEHKYNTVTYKATIANAVVDGIIPEKILAPKELLLGKAEENLDEWINRLERGDILTVNREELKVELYPDISDEEERRRRINSELSEFNRVGKTSKSSTMNRKFNDNPDSWYRYHKLRRESMKDWEEIPYEEIAKQITCVEDKVIDFGCGDNQFKDCISNQVTSVDHIACDDTVIACDMSDLSEYIKDESHDIAVFSLSLWGPNYVDYLKEAHRILVRRGMVYIAEPSKDYMDEDKQNEFISMLNEIGFKLVGKIDVRNKFTYITIIKI